MAGGRAIAPAVLDGRGPTRSGSTSWPRSTRSSSSHFETMARWARWAEREVRRWPDTSAPDDPARALEVFRRSLRARRPAR
ncbi:MAG TPA: hypothetical protein VNO79_01380 [Actinomycetota bacterium]|nr:hypothetical protein [Actinomycetota bacterium]